MESIKFVSQAELLRQAEIRSQNLYSPNCEQVFNSRSKNIGLIFKETEQPR